MGKFKVISGNYVEVTDQFSLLREFSNPLSEEESSAQIEKDLDRTQYFSVTKTVQEIQDQLSDSSIKNKNLAYTQGNFCANVFKYVIEISEKWPVYFDDIIEKESKTGLLATDAKNEITFCYDDDTGELCGFTVYETARPKSNRSDPTEYDYTFMSIRKVTHQPQEREVTIICSTDFLPKENKFKDINAQDIPQKINQITKSKSVNKLLTGLFTKDGINRKSFNEIRSRLRCNANIDARDVKKVIVQEFHQLIEKIFPDDTDFQNTVSSLLNPPAEQAVDFYKDDLFANELERVFMPSEMANAEGKASSLQRKLLYLALRAKIMEATLASDPKYPEIHRLSLQKAFLNKREELITLVKDPSNTDAQKYLALNFDELKKEVIMEVYREPLGCLYSDLEQYIKSLPENHLMSFRRDLETHLQGIGQARKGEDEKDYYITKEWTNIVQDSINATSDSEIQKLKQPIQPKRPEQKSFGQRHQKTIVGTLFALAALAGFALILPGALGLLGFLFIVPIPAIALLVIAATAVVIAAAANILVKEVKLSIDENRFKKENAFYQQELPTYKREVMKISKETEEVQAHFENWIKSVKDQPEVNHFVEIEHHLEKGEKEVTTGISVKTRGAPLPKDENKATDVKEAKQEQPLSHLEYPDDGFNHSL